jgi:flagellin-like protein
VSRAVVPVVASVVLVALTVALAGAVATATVGSAPPSQQDRPVLALSADAGADRLVLRHRAGPALNVSHLSLRVRVDGTPLTHQPPVPFFAARGFRAGPTGPFNAGGDPTWTAGERATLRLASTNHPIIEPGDRVAVRVTRDGRSVARLSTRA